MDELIKALNIKELKTIYIEYVDKYNMHKELKLSNIYDINDRIDNDN